MDDSQARKFQKDLNAGLVALVLLAVLERSTEDLYGYEIAKRLQRANDEGRAMLGQWSHIWRQTRGFVDRFIEGTDS